ncbi:MAG TPA: FtsX-like permease family protein, partial [Anaerolineaceae bacterium]|nr:FtsX-like permease family protein [Anaerolineaceae bacterium]
MMRPRWKKVLADLWSNKIRSLLVIASITVGLFAIGMIASLHTLLGEDMRSSYLGVNPANILVRASGFDQDWVDHLADLPGIRQVEGAAFYSLRMEVGKNDYIPVDIRAYLNYDEMVINQVGLVEGKWPPGDREIVIEKNKLADTNAKVGDYVAIKLGTGETRELQLVGVVHDQTVGAASTGGGFFLAPTQGFITMDTLDWLGLPQNYSYLYATVSDQQFDLAHIENVTDSVLKEFEKQGILVISSISRRSNDHPLIIYLDAISGVLFVLGFLVVFLSGFLITNTLSALLNQQIQQVGVMKTVGGTRAQINGIYMVLILVYSLISLALAVPLANLAATLEDQALASQINFLAGSQRMIPSAILIQVIIALVVPQLAGAIPVLQGTRISIQEAFNGSSGKIDDQGRFYRLLSRFRRLSRPLLISLRNTFRQRLRLILTLFTLILGGAIFIATFNVRASLDSYIDLLGKYFVADVNLAFDRPYRIDEVERLAAELPEVVFVEGWAATQAEVVRTDGLPGDSVSLQAPPVESTLIEPILLQGRWVQPGDENAIVLNELFLDKYPQLHVGDTLKLKVNGKNTDWVVVGFFQFAGKNTGLFAYTGYDYLARMMNISDKSAVYRVVAADGWHSVEKQKELAVRLEEHFTAAGYQVSDVRSGKSIRTYTTQGLNTLTTFLMIMAVLMAVVGSIGLTGTMGLNVMERTREIGIMRAIGASDGVLMRLVIVEGMLIGTISWLFACVVALPISVVMSDVISAAIFGSPIQFTFVLSGVLIWLAVVIGLSALASVL